MIVIPDVELSPHYSYASDLVNVGRPVITGSRRIAAKFSLGASHKHFHISEKSDDEALSALLRLGLSLRVSEQDPVCVLVGTDAHIQSFYRCYTSLQTSNVCLWGIAESAHNALANKVSSRSEFSARGIPTPYGVVPADWDDALKFVCRIGFPVIVKYCQSEGSRGVHVVKDKAGLRQALRKAELLNYVAVVEEFLGPTEEVSVQFVVEDSVVPLYVLRKLAHLQPSFSTAVERLVDLTKTPFVGYLDKLLNMLPRGLYSAQFKRNDCGEWCLLEINCRLGNNFRIVNRLCPGLTESIALFFEQAPQWRDVLETSRKRWRNYGVSPVEFLFGAIVRIRTRTGLLSKLGELSDHLILAAKLFKNGCVVDQYFVDFIKNPEAVYYYYSDVLAHFRTILAKVPTIYHANSR